MRPYLEDEDEDAIVSLWCQSYMRSYEGIDRRCYNPLLFGDAQRTDPRIRRNVRAFWAELAPVVEYLLRTATVVLAVDRERPTESALGPGIILGFLASDGADVVHYALVKRKFPRDMRAELMFDLIGERFERPCRYSFELVDLCEENSGVLVPPLWTRDPELYLSLRRKARPRPIRQEGDVT